MVTQYEISLTMDILLKNSFQHIKKTGGLYPALHLFKKGGPIDTQLTQEESKDLIENDQGKGLFDIHSTVAIFNNNSHQGPGFFPMVKKIVHRCKPDAVGLIIIALYKEFTNDEYKKISGTFNLSTDPEAIRVIHVCYYIQGNKVPGIRIIPFIDRSGVEYAVPEQDAVSEILGVEKPTRDVHFFDTPWVIHEKKITPWLKNPY